MYYLCMDNNEAQKITVERIEELMRAKGISRAKLAALAGVDRSAITNLLNGRRVQASPTTWEKIARALGTTVDYLRMQTDNPFQAEGEALPEYAVEIIETLRRLDSARRYELLVIARSLAAAHDEIAAASLKQAIQQAMAISDQISPDFTDKVAELLYELATSRSSSAPSAGEILDNPS